MQASSIEANGKKKRKSEGRGGAAEAEQQERRQSHVSKSAVLGRLFALGRPPKTSEEARGAQSFSSGRARFQLLPPVAAGRLMSCTGASCASAGTSGGHLHNPRRAPPPLRSDRRQLCRESRPSPSSIARTSARTTARWFRMQMEEEQQSARPCRLQQRSPRGPRQRDPVC